MRYLLNGEQSSPTISRQATLEQIRKGVRAAISGVSKPETTLSGAAIFTPKRQLMRDMTLEQVHFEIALAAVQAEARHGVVSAIYLRC